MNGKDTMIRAQQDTLRALRMAAMELAITRQEIFASDDERIRALVDYWNRTKPVVFVTETGVQPASPGLEGVAA